MTPQERESVYQQLHGHLTAVLGFLQEKDLVLAEEYLRKADKLVVAILKEVRSETEAKV